MGRLATPSSSGPPSMGCPNTLKSRPRVSGPTGTVMGPPRSTAFMPRCRPSVEAMAMQRTMLLPKCCAASTIRSISWPSASSLMWMAVSKSGSLSGENSMSTTGPMTWTTFPMLALIVKPPLELRLQCVRTAHYLCDFLGNLSLPHAVECLVQLCNELFRVFRGLGHGIHPGSHLTSLGLNERLIHRGVHIKRNQPFQYCTRRGLEDVNRIRARALHSRHLVGNGQYRAEPYPLGHGVDELSV